MKRALLLYGFWAWPARKGNWFHEEKVKLEELGYKVVMPLPLTPSSYFPSKRRWFKAIRDFKPDDNSVLIGFSLGGTAILDYFNRYNLRVSKVIFIATPFGLVDKGTKKSLIHSLVSKYILQFLGYLKSPYNWQKIKNTASKFVLIYKTNDPRVPLIQGKKLADKLNSKFITLEGKDHMWEIDLNVINQNL